MTSVFYDLKEINMTKEEILINALNNRCKYESSKEMDYDTHLAIMDAMDEYAQQQVKNCVIPAVSNSFTAEEVVNELEDCDTLDDAIMFFKEQM